MMDFDQARVNMIKQQIRTENVVDEALLSVLTGNPRDQFVPEAYRELAYADMNIPLDDTHSMLSPSLEAIILDALDIQQGEKVLEIGTGCAYLTALLAELSGDIVTLDSVDHVLPDIRKRLSNVNFQHGDAREGWQDLGGFDVIVLNGSVRNLPDSLLDQLNPGGRLFAIIGDDPIMKATLYTHQNSGALDQTVLLETSATRLPNADSPELFSF
ncbi:MAG TPA: protein-L-isoaspartate O-methyltransferase [Gammaproteobacteria bacterium]|nr:protein-L-isoaspartate O-methyltransferase [Gammaproteobacteria bacterium]